MQNQSQNVRMRFIWQLLHSELQKRKIYFMCKRINHMLNCKEIMPKYSITVRTVFYHYTYVLVLEITE